MNVSTMLRPGRESSASSAAEQAPVVTVRPVRAAFGPHVSLVSVDNEGRLWMRFSTAVGMMLAGLVLMMIPVASLYFVGDDLVESGQVTLTEQQNPATNVNPAGVNQAGVPSELPLADTSD